MTEVIQIAWLEESAKVSTDINQFTVLGLVVHYTKLQSFKFLIDVMHFLLFFLTGTNREKTNIFRELCDQTV